MEHIDSEHIILSGLGELSDTELAELRVLAEPHGVTVSEGYFDWQLEGDADCIEEMTMSMWGMPRDQWEENGFSAVGDYDSL